MSDANNESEFPDNPLRKTPVITRKNLNKIMGLEPLHDPLPAEMSALDKIKIYAHEGFASGYGGNDEEFERIWREAFPRVEAEKGSKR